MLVCWYWDMDSIHLVITLGRAYYAWSETPGKTREVQTFACTPLKKWGRMAVLGSKFSVYGLWLISDMHTLEESTQAKVSLKIVIRQGTSQSLWASGHCFRFFVQLLVLLWKPIRMGEDVVRVVDFAQVHSKLRNIFVIHTTTIGKHVSYKMLAF